MTSVSAFNDMLEQFLQELNQTFPEEKAIVKYQTSVELLRKTNPRKVIEGFMSNVASISERMLARDESLITSGDINSLIPDINISGHWSECSDNTRNAIWQYLQTLYMLGTTITSLPSDTLNMIEDVAQKAAANMDADGGGIDQGAIMKMLGGMFGGK